MNADQLTHFLAFERANSFVGCAPMGAWAADPGKNDETPDGPRWRAKLSEPVAIVGTSAHLVRRLFLDTGPYTYYVEAWSGDGTFWAKVPDALVEEVKAVFGM